MASVTIAGYAFSGPYSFVSLLRNEPGVWAVLDGRTLPPVDAGQAEDIRAAVKEHPRYDCWREACQRVTYASLNVPAAERRAEILELLLEEYTLPCRPR